MREKTKTQGMPSDKKTDVEADARGQSEKDHKGGRNSGVSSANPRSLSKDESGDATFPLDRSDGSKTKAD